MPDQSSLAVILLLITSMSLFSVTTTPPNPNLLFICTTPKHPKCPHLWNQRGLRNTSNYRRAAQPKAIPSTHILPYAPRLKPCSIPHPTKSPRSTSTAPCSSISPSGSAVMPRATSSRANASEATSRSISSLEADTKPHWLQEAAVTSL